LGNSAFGDLLVAIAEKLMAEQAHGKQQHDFG